MKKVWLAFCLVLCASLGLAHKNSFGRIRLEVQTGSLRALVEIPLSDLELIDPTFRSNPDPQRIGQNMLSRMILRADSKPLEAKLQSAQFGKDSLLLRLEFAATNSQNLELEAQLIPTDRQYKTLLDIYVQDKLYKQLVFDAQTPKHNLQLEVQQNPWQVVSVFVMQGLYHIFIGLDHILFVVSLLLAGGTVWQICKIITAFTCAHAVTLSLATLEIVRLPDRPVEAAIAASIVFVAVQSLRPRERDFRILFAFIFGLIHGFGFASVLSELGLPQKALLWSLSAFHLGVELGQVCIVLLVFPLLLWLKRQSGLLRYAIPFGTVAVALVGTFWFFQRVFFE
ncbi:MAG: HupE/UreJ family protein [Deinococcales bacterium]